LWQRRFWEHLLRDQEGVNAQGFSLHAEVRCAAHQRKKLEHLCRYITRAAIANERLTLNRARAGQVVLTLKTPYRDGTTHIVMSALELMQRLAALVPRPRLHLIRFHGVLAQNKLNHFPYIDQYCLDHGLLEHRIETTSEVVSILIG